MNITLTRLKKISAIFSIATIIIMLLIKVIAFYTSDSVSVLASMIDTGADLLTTSVAAITIFTSVKPADSNHRYGHYKAESIGVLFQSIFLLISGLFIFGQGVYHIITKHVTNIDNLTIGIMIVALILNIALVSFQRFVVNLTSSKAIKADMINYTGDIFVTIGVIISLFLTKSFGIHHIDAIFGMAIAFFLFMNARKLFLEAVDILMDKEIDPKVKRKITKIINSEKNVLGYHDFRSRSCGSIYFIEVHIELNKNLKFKDAHEISHQLKQKILKLAPEGKIELIIHQDIHDGKKHKKIQAEKKHEKN